MNFIKTRERDGIMFRYVVITAASAVVLSASANAADIYRAPPPAVGGYKDTPYLGVNWSGFYVGVNGGYGWNGTGNLDAGSPDPSGGFGGGQIGYNWQGVLNPNVVLGIEADFQGAGISDSGTHTEAGHTSAVRSDLNWFGTARGRLGYAFGGALLYGTGGFAYGEVKNRFFPTETQTGWTAGGGMEYKLAPAWSLKGEYQFLSLDANDNAGAGRLGDAELGRTDVHTFRLGVNYFVGHGYEPLK
jgi:outer membrane immunogenic protein